MLKSIRLKNFKCFQDSGKIELNPLTILCGTNSCGKTTIIQSMLFLKQSFENIIPNKNFILNGRFTRLGSFKDAVYNHILNNEMIIELEIEISPRKFYDFLGFLENQKNLSLGYDHEEARKEYDSLPGDTLSQKQKRDYKKYNNCILKISYGLKSSMKMNITKKLKISYLKLETTAQDNKTKKIVSGAYIEIINTNESEYSVQWRNIAITDKVSYVRTLLDNIGIKNRYFCPKCKKYHRTRSKTGEQHFQFSISESKENMRLKFQNFYPIITKSKDKLNITNFQFIFECIKHAIRICKSEFENFHYLGPLREEPYRRYIYEEEHLEIGIKGENAPIILLTEEKKKIPIFYTYDSGRNTWNKNQKMNLREAIIIWMKYLGIYGNYMIEAKEDVLYFYLFNEHRKKEKATLADVGFGVSQILPILIEGLRIKSKQHLILEQPEIHLHPKLQMLLADFFIALALSKKMIIIETHSDHIINRLVRRIVEDKKFDISSKIKIYFLEVISKKVNINPINIDETMGITNWPRDFFDQAASEKIKIVEAGIEKRKLRRIEENENM
jgi:predicted ATPase